MKKTQLLIFAALFCAMTFGFSVIGKANNVVFDAQEYANADSRNENGVSPANSLSAFNHNTLSVLNRFEPVNAQRRYWLRIANNSRWDIRRLYLSNTEEGRWGPDQLGLNVLSSGGSFTLTDIRPGEYDVMFVDEDNYKCVLRNIQIFKNLDWTLTSNWLIKCQGG